MRACPNRQRGVESIAAAAFAVHRPLGRVPENTLKFAVGVVISSFGTFWTGEGLGVAWPGQDVGLSDRGTAVVRSAGRRAARGAAFSGHRPGGARMRTLRGIAM